MIVSSLYPIPKDTFKISIGSCGSCDICIKFLIYSNTFTCAVIKKGYFVKWELKCNTDNIIYLILCKLCSKQFIGSATNFKNRFSRHKGDILTKKDSSGTERCFNKCSERHDSHKYYAVQITEPIIMKTSGNCYSIGRNTGSQLLTVTYDINSLLDSYSGKRKSCGRK